MATLDDVDGADEDKLKLDIILLIGVVTIDTLGLEASDATVETLGLETNVDRVDVAMTVVVS